MEQETVMEMVCNYFNLDITRTTQKKEYVEARAFYYRLMRQHTRSSLYEIGKSVNRDHTSVLYGMKQLYNWMQVDTSLKAKYRILDNKLKQCKAGEEIEINEAEIIDTNIKLKERVKLLEQLIKEKDLIIEETKQVLDELEAKTRKKERFYAKYGYLR
jgi:hypothetical protein